ncbi:thiamine-phosphate kinase [soil metagenome]
MLRPLATDPAARGLLDDSAHLPGGASGTLIVTTDTIVEGVHFLSSDPAGDVAGKLLAVNLSDLAAKGATPIGALLNYPLTDDAWDAAFVAGLGIALAELGCPLIGGDTVALPQGAPRVLTLTALGTSPAAPVRSGAQAGDALYVLGAIGDAGAGLAIARGEPGPAALLAAYRRPRPLLAEGQALAPHVTAMMDVSDGLLIDAERMASASGLAVTIDLAAIPLSPELIAHSGDSRATRLSAATAGDDYALLFAAPTETTLPIPAIRIGGFGPGSGLTLHDGGRPLPLPDRLGFQHGV